MYSIIFLLGLLAGTPTEVAQEIQHESVTVMAPKETGSGTLIHKKDKDYVLTCAHTLENADLTGKTYNVTVYQDIYVDGEFHHRNQTTAKVLRYSPNNTGRDLAILELDKQFGYTAKFYREFRIPTVGTPIYHCGSFRGAIGHNCVAEGIISFNGRYDGKYLFDNCALHFYPGSSGGGIFLKDGRYIGMLTRGWGTGFAFMIPIREIYKWLDSEKLLWLLDN
jgi:hypothetical protein